MGGNTFGTWRERGEVHVFGVRVADSYMFCKPLICYSVVSGPSARDFYGQGGTRLIKFDVGFTNPIADHTEAGCVGTGKPCVWGLKVKSPDSLLSCESW